MVWTSIMKEYCCDNLKKLLIDFDDTPLIIKKDLSIDILGYHEVYNDDTPSGLKFKFCPFCARPFENI